MNYQSASWRIALLLALALIIGAVIWILARAFTGELVIDPVAFSIGSIHVRWYGLLIALAILLAILWVNQRAAARGITSDVVERSFWWTVFGGIIGARFLYVLQNVEFFTQSSERIVAIMDGGLSIHGALVGGAIALSASTEFSRQLFWKLADVSAPPLLLGMILGRFGNFANAELFGPATDVAWKMFVPITSRPIETTELAFYHPTFLYDLLLNSLLLLVLLRFESTTKFTGETTLRFFFGIAITRFIVEFWRLGDITATGLTSAQLASLLIAATAGALLFLGRSGRIRFSRS